MSLPTSCCPTGYTGRPLHHLVDNETFSLTVPFNLDVPPAVGYDDYRVKSKLFLIHLEKSENRGHEPQAIFVKVEPFGCDSP
jgi:hypothetical protein